MHVPPESDIIILDYTVNDIDEPEGNVMDNQVRRPFERLIRKLLNYPRRPAVLLLHAYTWFRVVPFSGAFWTSCERDFHEFAMYYKLPEVSVKASCWKLMDEDAKRKDALGSLEAALRINGGAPSS
eukprot:gene444-1844_t